MPILVSRPGERHATTISQSVTTTQIAPTILRLLGIDPEELQAVRAEHTQALPELG